MIGILKITKITLTMAVACLLASNSLASVTYKFQVMTNNSLTEEGFTGYDAAEQLQVLNDPVSQKTKAKSSIRSLSNRAITLKSRYVDLNTSRHQQKTLDDLDMEFHKRLERVKVIDLCGKYNEENLYSYNMRSELNHSIVPIPGALLLGSLGIGCVGFLRRHCRF